MAESPARLRFRIRRSDFEVELEGPEEYVKEEYERLMKELARPDTEVVLPPPKHGITHSARKPTSGGVPSTIAEKFAKLKEEGVFSAPKNSGEIAQILRDRGWGVFVSKDISSMLKRIGPKLGLRRMPLGKGKYGYRYP